MHLQAIVLLLCGFAASVSVDAGVWSPLMFQPGGANVSQTVDVVDLLSAPNTTALAAITLQGLANRRGSAVYVLLHPWDEYWLVQLKASGSISATRNLTAEQFFVSYSKHYTTVIVADPMVEQTYNLANYLASVVVDIRYSQQDGIVIVPDQLSKLGANKTVVSLEGAYTSGADVLKQQRQPVEVLAMYDPTGRGHGLRDYLSARSVITVWCSADPQEMALVAEIFAKAPPNIPVIGFYASSGYSEYTGLLMSGQHGKYNVVCDWATNLSFLSSFQNDLQSAVARYRRSLKPPRTVVNKSKVYVALQVVESGDSPGYWQNRQYSVWSDPARGTVPVSWGVGWGTFELAPVLMEHYLNISSPNDYLYLAISGLAYAHPYRSFFENVTTISRDEAWARYLGNVSEAMKRFNCSETGLYTDAWKYFNRTAMDPVTRRFAAGLSGMRGPPTLVLGMGRDEGVDLPGSNYDLDGAFVSHIMTRWDKDYADKSPEQNVAWLVNDIRTQVAKSSERPLFLSAMALSWAYNPAQMKQVFEELGPNFEAVSLPDLRSLRAQHIKGQETTPCKQLPPAMVSEKGYNTSMKGCIGSQGHDASRNLAFSADCSAAKLNFSAAADIAAGLCNATPGCAAFSVLSPDYPGSKTAGKLMCELHPEGISESSETNQWWSVWQRNSVTPGRWPHNWGPPPPPPPPSPEASLVWNTPSSSVLGSMPLGNGRLGVNVYADSNDTIWLLVSHVDALDENTNLDKLGRVAVRAIPTSREAVPQLFRQEMDLQNGVVHVDLTNGVRVDVWVDALADVVRVESNSTLRHRLEATLEVWRNTSGPYPGGRPLGCASLHPNVTLHADIVKSEADSIAFYHRNLAEWTMPPWEVDLKNQDMPPDTPATRMTNITFGGLLTGTGDNVMTRTSPMTLMSKSDGTSLKLSIAGIAGYYRNGTGTFFEDLAREANKPMNRSLHSAAWAAFWNRSDITVRPSATPMDNATAAAAPRVTLLDKVNRAAFHAMSGGSISAIKFNAYGIFAAYLSPKEDYRVWGPCQWFQNIRLPYYHMLADGQFEDMKSLFNFYHSIFGVSKARTRGWFGINGTFFPETAQQSGIYDSGGLGWQCQSASPTRPIPGNGYIRYHREGGLELSLMALDWFDHTGDLDYFRTVLLPQIDLYVQYYIEHFETDPKTGKLDMFPGQALETWQCLTIPPQRSDCVTNPMPQVAGLHAVLPRLLDLSTEVIPDQTMRAKWAKLLGQLPDLPVGNCMQGDKTSSCLLPGASLPLKTSNAENADLYAVHPFRIVNMMTNRSLGVTTYENRRFRGNTGWSEDLMDAAILGLGNETAAAAIARADVPPYTGYRWVGFQAGIGAGGPITDHGGVATAGLRYMLLLPSYLQAGHQSKLIVLFPSWPCHDWAVDFKLHAAGQTIVEGSYDGAGTLSKFSVSPLSRAKDVHFASCVKTVQWL